MPDLTWQKSSYSQQGNCIEIARHGPDVIIRDTDNPANFITVTAADWQAFLAGVKADEFDQHQPEQETT
jgi:predicted secreted Zn-dependent protease